MLYIKIRYIYSRSRNTTSSNVLYMGVGVGRGISYHAPGSASSVYNRPTVPVPSDFKQLTWVRFPPPSKTFKCACDWTVKYYMNWIITILAHSYQLLPTPIFLFFFPFLRSSRMAALNHNVPYLSDFFSRRTLWINSNASYLCHLAYWIFMFIARYSRRSGSVK